MSEPTKGQKIFSLNSNPVMTFKVHAVVYDCSDEASDDATVIVYSHNDHAAPQFSRPAAEFYRDFTEV